jgi:hypothetical protein
MKTSIYRIPVCKREVDSDILVEDSIDSCCMNINELGMFVRFSESDGRDISSVDSSKAVVKNEVRIFNASRCESAIGIFHKSEGAGIGGEAPYSKALWIDEERPIIEFPYCTMMHRNDDGRFTCGKPLENGNGEFGGCVVETRKAPHHCVFTLFWKQLCLNFDMCYRFADEVLGYKVIRPEQVKTEFF